MDDLQVPRVLAWAGKKVPAQFLDEVRIEVDTSPSSITIYECRPPWGSPGCILNWTRQPVARLRHNSTANAWSLYWADGHGKFHKYDQIEPGRSVQPLLDEIDRDPTGIFWG